MPRTESAPLYLTFFCSNYSISFKKIKSWFKKKTSAPAPIPHHSINIEEFVKIVNSYYKKTDHVLSKVDEIDTWLLKFDQFLKPYETITLSLKKTFANLTSEIYRRKDEYTAYLNSIKDEGLRVDIRTYVDGKITKRKKKKFLLC